jgi:hypothetical protein
MLFHFLSDAYPSFFHFLAKMTDFTQRLPVHSCEGATIDIYGLTRDIA